MQHQAVPLSQSKKCIVGTGLERQIALDSRVSAIAKHKGNIIDTITDRISLFGNGHTLSIPLTIYQRFNKNTCMHKKSQVRRGKCIKKGQILADGAVDSELTLKKNVLVAYMSWTSEYFIDKFGALANKLTKDKPMLWNINPNQFKHVTVTKNTPIMNIQHGIFLLK